jgi:phosphoserine / homoserine phosphotransferase
VLGSLPHQSLSKDEAMMHLNIACIDMEGVLIPELWPYIAQRANVPQLALTTREEPDYKKLVLQRIARLHAHGLRMQDLQSWVADLEPLDGAVEFLIALKHTFNVVLVSDAFFEMVQPLWHKLGRPAIRCHQLIHDHEGFVQSPLYSRQHGKHEVIEEYLSKQAWVLAVGDAHNDLSMIRSASLGLLFRPSIQTLKAARDVTVVQTYQEILDQIVQRSEFSRINAQTATA